MTLHRRKHRSLQGAIINKAIFAKEKESVWNKVVILPQSISSSHNPLRILTKNYLDHMPTLMDTNTNAVDNAQL
ncbi:hypothetical protein HW555_010993 [Spodoptera exigua]|uniref:Uncharacterized protein n=1 Tax=Spodoptera exigua TaxID=7107 RepID=A0A835L104_SPOEX|nr:hypothetical protein HW555_010993 [Spodoptera exigua]